MTTDKPIKCASRDFTTTPFFLLETNGSDKCFVASFRSMVNIKEFLRSFIDQSNGDLQIKIRDYENSKQPTNFDGQADKALLQITLDTFETVIFYDGYHDFMIRRPETGDYVVFDEHGLLFIYTQDDYSDTLLHYGLVAKTSEKLIYEFAHWHYRPPGGREELKKLITTLRLQ